VAHDSASTRGTAERPVRTRFGPVPILLFPLSLACSAPCRSPRRSQGLLAAAAAGAGRGLGLRAGVRVTPAALVVGNGLRRRGCRGPTSRASTCRAAGPVRLLHDGRRTPLLALPRRELPMLLEAAERVAGPGSTGSG
jgi:hypothetical protein